MSAIEKLVQRAAPATPLTLGPLNATSLRDQAYALLKSAIADTDIYDPNQELRLDERQLTTALGVSRTPIREALSLLEQEGFIASEWGVSDNNRKAKFYKLTRSGKKQLEKEAREWEQATAILSRFLDAEEQES